MKWVLIISTLMFLLGCVDEDTELDTDLDGITNNIDTDGDGVADIDDAFPLDNSESVDTDDDGVGDNADMDDYLNTNVSSLQEQIDAGGNDTIINLNGDVLYIFDGTLSLRDYSGIHLNGNGATIKREDSNKISSELIEDYEGITSDYDGFTDIHVLDNKFKIGDWLMISSGISINDLSIDARQVVSMEDNKITVKYAFTGEFNSGDVVFKSYKLIGGMASSVENGTNPNTIIENINFDGNARNNNINNGWTVNGTIGLHGGKSSEIKNNTFSDIPNETIVGHGVLVHDNEFIGLNGSAFHTSVHDKTFHLNGYSEFKDNTVIDINRIEKGLNGHSEGAISLSWGAGNLVVSGNYFESYTGNYGVLGAFSGALEHTDENLTVRYNEAYNFEYIIKIYSPTESPTRNISITENIFDATGINDFSHLISNETIKFGCNTLTSGTEIIGNLAC